MIRTFPDSNVLIEGGRGNTQAALRAEKLLEDPGRQMLTSPLVRLETVPKAAFSGRPTELAFYRRFFGNSALEWARDINAMYEIAEPEAELHGMGAVDALHVAAAYLLRADELVTAERPGRAMYRTSLVRVVYLY